MRVLTIGGGIGGLFAARTLARAGHAVTLVERAPEPSAIGAGLMLSSRALRLLEQERIPVKDIAFPLRRLSVLGPDGRTRASVRDRYSLTRADLLNALLHDLDQIIDLRYGSEVTQTVEHEDHVEVQTDKEVLTYDLVIGADGIRSRTRDAITRSPYLRSAGQHCRRAIVTGVPGMEATETWNGDVRVGIVPLGNGRHYVYLVERGHASPAPLNPAAYEGLPHRERVAVDAVAALSDEVLHHGLWELQRPVWGAGRTVLLGDAAHAMTPNLGLGAAMAIEDGVALSAALTQSPNGSWRRYRRHRAARVRALQLVSRRVGDLAHSTRVTPRLARKALGLQP